MQPAKKQSDTNKPSLLIFILKMTIKALEIKSDDIREKLRKVLNNKDKYAKEIGNIQDKDIRRHTIIRVLDIFSKYLNFIVQIKKIKEVTRDYEEIQKRIKNSYFNLDNNSSAPENTSTDNNKREIKKNNANNCLIEEKDSIKEKDKNHPKKIEDNASKRNCVNEQSNYNIGLIWGINNNINFDGK